MQLDLNTLGTAGEHLDLCEEAINEGAFATARTALDDADTALDQVREHYKTLGAGQRKMLAALAKPVSQRRDELAARLPKSAVISEGAAEPEQAEDGDVETLLSA